MCEGTSGFQRSLREFLLELCFCPKGRRRRNRGLKPRVVLSSRPEGLSLDLWHEGLLVR